MEDVKKYLRMILNIVIPLAGLCLVCFLGPKLLSFFMPFVIGWIIAMIANPLVRFLERHLKLVRRHGSMVIIVGVLVLVIGLLYLAITWIYSELAGFVGDLPLLYENALREISNAIQNSQKLLTYLPDSLQKPLLEISNNLGGTIGTLFSKAAAPTVEIAGNVAKRIPNVMVNTVIMILASYLFLAEREKILRVLRAVLPPFVFRYMDYLKKDARGLIGGYFLAQFRIMFVVAAILAAGLLILGVKYSLLLAIFIALLDFLPIFGTGTVLIPWAVVKLFSAEYPYAVGLILIYITTQVVRQIIQPKIVGDSMGLPPLLTLFLLYMGFKLSGIAGMILAVPIGLVFINFYKYGAFDSMIENMKMLIKEISEFRKGGGD